MACILAGILYMPSIITTRAAALPNIAERGQRRAVKTMPQTCQTSRFDVRYKS